MKDNQINKEHFIDNFNFIKSIISTYYPNNNKIRAELYDIWFCGIKKNKKLVYVDIQKGFKKSFGLYNKIIKNQKYINSFQKRYRFYDITNNLHYTYWFNSKNLWEKDSNVKMKVNKEISKKFGYLFFKKQIPNELKNIILNNFDKNDEIVLIGGYKNKCLLETLNTFIKLGYTHVHINNAYIYK